MLKEYVKQTNSESAVAVFIESLTVGKTFLLNDVSYTVKQISDFVKDADIAYIEHKEILIATGNNRPFKIKAMHFIDGVQFFHGGKRYYQFAIDIKNTIEKDLECGRLSEISLMLDAYIKKNWDDLF